MKRWKGAALLLLCTVVLLRLLQGLAQPEKENAHVPVLGIVTTAAEDDRREAQSEALVHAAEEHGFKVLEMPVERTQEAQIEAVRALIVYQVDAIAFTPLVESVHVSYWKENPIIFLTYAALGIGFLIGIFFSSGVLTKAFEKARQTAYFPIVGLSLGSIAAMFCNVEIFAVYKEWAQKGISQKDLWLGVALFVVGAVIADLLVRYQREKDAESAVKTEEKQNDVAENQK